MKKIYELNKKELSKVDGRLKITFSGDRFQPYGPRGGGNAVRIFYLDGTLHFHNRHVEACGPLHTVIKFG